MRRSNNPIMTVYYSLKKKKKKDHGSFCVNFLGIFKQKIQEKDGDGKAMWVNNISYQ